MNASFETVWQILTNFDTYPQWNPFIREAEGEIKKGQKLTFCIQPSESGEMKLKPIILEAEPNRELR
ncbi:MAG: hypothetical protein EA343_10755 [Nodularia sp. (in: Bacteria)]|nr:MAG: hypothetical protein EA343_10755 [Nodularia sp. (in: cyanobacteria)]